MGCKRDKTGERSLDGQRNKCCTTSGGAVISKGGSRRESLMAKWQWNANKDRKNDLWAQLLCLHYSCSVGEIEER